MSRRSLIILGAIVALALVTFGLREFGRRPFLEPLADATTDVAQYPAVLAKWKPTGLASHFPTTIPASAQLVRFSAFPGSGQGHSWVQLRVKLPPAEVAAIAASARATAGRVYGAGADNLNANSRKDWPGTSFHTGDQLDQLDFPDSYTVYVIDAVDRGGGSWDPHDGYGIAVSEFTKEVVYWADR